MSVHALAAVTCSDLKKFRFGLNTELCADECMIAENGYTDTRCIQILGQHHPEDEFIRGFEHGMRW